MLGNKSKKFKKRKMQEFASTYSLKNAFVKGDIFTKLSAVVMGLGNIVRGQVVKGLLFLAVQAAYIIYMIKVGIGCLADLKLGGVNAEEIWDEAQGIYVYTHQDRTILFLLYGIVAIVITALFIIVWANSITSAYRAQCLKEEGKRPDSFKKEFKTLFDKNMHKFLLAVPIAGVIAFTILPLIFMISMAFTTYDYNHSLVFHWNGLKNFAEALNLKDTVGKEFWPVLGWTLCWAVAATFSNYILGTILAIIINRKGTRLKSMWRFNFMLSAAIPQFVSLLLMRTMFNQNGVINNLFGTNIAFWDTTFWARFLVIMINIWVGVPFTMLQVTGVLQNIPAELYEAAKVDGAGPVKVFFKITMPYLLFVTGPYLITSFTGNINNFNVIFLLSGGNPPQNLAATSGKTDLLVTWLYKLTVGTDRPQYNVGAVIGILTFIVLASLSLLTYHRTGAYKNEEGFQ
jgi:arabinogalactan oligomer/maltooligosaccharide transport system permease protein